MHARCSTDSRYFRWFAALSPIPEAYLDGAVAGRDDHVAVVAVAAGVVVGLPSAVRTGTVRELGVLVQDDHQRRSAGTALLDRLIDDLRAREVASVRADVLVGRRRLLERLAKYGPIEIRLVDEVLRATVVLTQL